MENKFSPIRKFCDTCKPEANKLLIKFYRIRNAVRTLNRCIKERTYAATSNKYNMLLQVADDLAWAAGQIYGSTDNFVWLRMTRDELKEYNEWKVKKLSAKPVDTV